MSHRPDTGCFQSSEWWFECQLLYSYERTQTLYTKIKSFYCRKRRDQRAVCLHTSTSLGVQASGKLFCCLPNKFASPKHFWGERREIFAAGRRIFLAVLCDQLYVGTLNVLWWKIHSISRTYPYSIAKSLPTHCTFALLLCVLLASCLPVLCICASRRLFLEMRDLVGLYVVSDVQMWESVGYALQPTDSGMHNLYDKVVVRALFNNGVWIVLTWE